MDIVIGNTKPINKDPSQGGSFAAPGRVVRKNRRKNRKDRRKGVREGIIISISGRKDRRKSKDRRKPD